MPLPATIKIRKFALKLRRSRDERDIRASGLFSPDWYEARYPDVAGYPGGPLRHYLAHGAREGRAAGPRFDTAAYLAANPDVEAGRVNPLAHYIRQGAQEGRGFAPAASTCAVRAVAGTGEARPATVALALGWGTAWRATLDSVLGQGGPEIELFVQVPGSGSDEAAVSLRRLTGTDPRVRLVEQPCFTAFLREAAGRSGSAFVACLDAGDILLPGAVAAFADRVAGQACDVVYCDEEQIRPGAREPVPILKPSWSPELLTAFNYFGHLTAIRRGLLLDVLREVSVLPEVLPDAATGPAAEWDINLRATERTRAIMRLPLILCRRAGPSLADHRLPARAQSTEAGSGPARATAARDPGTVSDGTATGPGCEPDDADAAAARAFWRRRGREARVMRAPDGSFAAAWSLPEPPLVSIVVPLAPHASVSTDLRARLLEHLSGERTAYDNLEIVLAEAGPLSREVPDEAAGLQPGTRPVRRAALDGAFNPARARNRGAALARGTLLLFLDPDIVPARPDWLENLVRMACEPGIGVVGPGLADADGERQAGIAFGLFEEGADVSFRAPRDVLAAFAQPGAVRERAAVAGACQIVRRSLFDLVGGYDEALSPDDSEAALCLDLARFGFRTVELSSTILRRQGERREEAGAPGGAALFARRLRRLGFSADPYSHPALDRRKAAPGGGREPSHALRKAPWSAPWRGRPALLPGSPHAFRSEIDRLAGPAGPTLDIHDDGAVAAALGRPWDAVARAFDPAALRPGAEAGARVLIAFLRRRSDLRARFPRALRDGPDGGFARWVTGEGLRLLGLGPDFAASIEAAFAADPGAAARTVLLFDAGLRAEQPLFLLPAGAADAARVLFRAHDAGTLGLESLWWFLLHAAEDPQAEMCATWAITPAWQEAVPDGGTVFGVAALARWVARTWDCRDAGIFAQTYPAIMSEAAQVRLAYAARPDWRARFPDALREAAAAQALLAHLATRAAGLHVLARTWVSERLDGRLAREVVRPGLNILGHLAYPSGLRVSTESLIRGLRENGVELSLRDVPVSARTDEAVGHRFTGCEIYDASLIHVQPEPLFDTAYAAAGLRPRPERTYRIGYWYWEFDEVPAAWDRQALDCDEIWTATEFVAEGLRRRCRQPVRVLMPGLEIEPFTARPRSYYGLDEDAFVFLFAFHMTSVMDRKNPLGLIQAFRAAFADEPRARLVIKTSFGDRHPAAMATLVRAGAEAGVTILDADHSRDELLGLIDAADAYVSLHRSEGLGLSMAEAMLLGKPVVATRYSGNLSFMDDANSLLVDHRLVALGADIPPYEAHRLWAEPSVAQAAAHMRRLFDAPAFARDLGARAKADLEVRLNHRAAGRRIAARLQEIARL